MPQRVALLLTVLACLAVARHKKVVATAPETSPKSEAVQLLSAGQHPRVLLRLRPTANQRRSVLVTAVSNAFQKWAGNAAPRQRTAEQRYLIDIWVKKVLPNGDIRCAIKFTSLEVQSPPDSASGEGEAPAGAVVRESRDVSAEMLVDNRGNAKGAELRSSPKANPNIQKELAKLQRVLQNASLAFPEEPVGVDARWQVRQPLPPDDLFREDVTTYRVISIHGNDVELSVQTEQHALSHVPHIPGLPERASVELLSASSNGRGAVTVNLTQPMPAHAELHVSSFLNLRINAEGKSQDMQLSLDTSAHLQDAPHAANSR